jgi:hypothetical protein
MAEPILVLVRIPAGRETVEAAARQLPGVYERVLALAREHGLVDHRRAYRDGETLDVDVWPSEEARARFSEQALPLLRQLQEARGCGPSTVEVWRP